MIKLLFLLLFCNIFLAETHFLKIYYTGSSKRENNRIVLEVDGNPLGSCDHKILKTNYDWAQKALHEISDMHTFYIENCFQILPHLFAYKISSVTKESNQSEGVHIVQRIDSCFLDDDNGKVPSLRYGFDGEDFMELNYDTLLWIALSPQAEQVKQEWGTGLSRDFIKELLNYRCILWLKICLEYGKSVLQRTDLPSVSLLQKTPSSPIRCHATGFYPNRAQLFWTKDGEEIHENVEHGEILPNEDGSFQMMVDLNVSSVSIEDWERFNCVFHLSSGVDKIILKMDKAVIKTNYERPHQTTAPIITAVLIFGAVIAAGLVVAFKIKRKRSHLRVFEIPSTSTLTHENSF